MSEVRRLRRSLPNPTVGWDELAIHDETYQLDEIYLRWLKKVINSHEWNKIPTAKPGGGVEVRTIPISNEQIVAIGRLGQYLDEAKKVTE